MANEIYSKEVALEVDMGYPANPNWKLAICTISKSFNKNTGSVTLNNDCTGDFVRELPTDASWNMSIEGNISSDPGPTELSANELQVLQDNKEVRPFRLRSLDGSYYREGLAFINQLDETGTAGEYLTFSLGLRGSDRSIYAPEVLVDVVEYSITPTTYDTVGDVIAFSLTISNLSKRTITATITIANIAFSTSVVLDPEEANVEVTIPNYTTTVAANTPMVLVITTGAGYQVTESVMLTYTP